MTQETAHLLRRRAGDLRHLASDIEGSSIMALHRYASDETWRGTRPHRCVELLRIQQTRLRRDAIDLRSQADAFERRADELEQVASMQHGHVP